MADSHETLLRKAREAGLQVEDTASDKDLKKFLDDTAATSKDVTAKAEEAPALTQSAENNDNGEKTNGTTKDGSTAAVKTTTSVPQNGVTSASDIKTSQAFTDGDYTVAEKADKARTDKEVKFADESNPNQKARNAAAPEDFDQDGNERGGGYSYGVADDDVTNLSKAAVKANSGKEQDQGSDSVAKVDTAAPVLNGENTYPEWTVEDQQKLEKSLSDSKNGVAARVTISVGNYVQVLFYLDNKPLGSYESRDFKEADAKKHLKELLDTRPQYV